MRIYSEANLFERGLKKNSMVAVLMLPINRLMEKFIYDHWLSNIYLDMITL